MWASLLALGSPINPGRQSAQCNPKLEDCVHMVWSGNWAAVVGILLCICLLVLWFETHIKSKEKDDEQL